MIRYLKHDEIDFGKWDACIGNAVNGIFYGYSWYLDICADRWDALVENDYQAVMPLPYRRKAGVKYIYQPFFIQQLGVFSTHHLTKTQCTRFLEAIPRQFRFGEFNMNTFNSLPDDHPFINGAGVTCELDLIAPYEKLKGKYSNNMRRNIKKARDNGVYVTQCGRPEEVIDAFRNNRGRRKIPFSERDYKVLKRLIYAGIHKGMATIRCAYTRNNEFCAGIVFFTSHKKSVWLFSGAMEAARKTSAMSLVVNDYISEHAGREHILDFEGSSDPNLARFYRGFGSEECVFLRIKFNHFPLFMKPFVQTYLFFRKYV